MHNVVSVHGFIADDNDDIGPLFDWYTNGPVELFDGRVKLTQQSADYLAPSGPASGRDANRPSQACSTPPTMGAP